MLRLRGLIMVTHEEQLERIDGRLLALYPTDFLAVVSQAEALGTEPPDFLTWYAQRRSSET
jgi:DNA polymerase IIIc chi subunit